MKSLGVGAVLLIGAASIPAMAQTNPSATQPNSRSSEQQYQPGEGGRSKAGVPGQPGNKSGPATDKSNGGAAAGEQGSMSPDNGAAAGSDESKVPGLPGNKSGPSTPSK